MKRTTYIWVKWVARLSLVYFMLSHAFYWAAWRSGVIHYGCMQPVNQTMRDQWAMMKSPWFNPAIDMAFTISSLLIITMAAELKFGSRLPAKKRQFWLFLKKYWKVLLPACAVFLWPLLTNSTCYGSGSLWFIVTVLACIAIFFDHERPKQYEGPSLSDKNWL